MTTTTQKRCTAARRAPDDTWTTFTAANSGLPANDVLAVAVDKQAHKAWAGLNRVGLCRFNGRD